MDFDVHKFSKSGIFTQMYLHISCEFHHKGHSVALRDVLTVGRSLSPSLRADLHPTEFELIVILTQVIESKLVILLLTRVRILVTWGVRT